MKNILITGSNSYIGNSLKEWLANYPNEYKVEAISVRGEQWKNEDFSKYDVVFHAAGIAHQKETDRNAGAYYLVNRDMAYNVAKKAKAEKVGQFIFLSSMSVYGMDTGVIDENTKPNPKSHYGKSKLEAEQLIQPLEDKDFKVAVIRPPMIYGKGCKGNYQSLSKLAKITPIFPKIENQRSMIYIDNLSEFTRLLIDNKEAGMFHPQNEEYVCTSDMVKQIAEVRNKKLVFTKSFNKGIQIGSQKFKTISKVFGDLTYSGELSLNNKNYRVSNFIDSVQDIENPVVPNEVFSDKVQVLFLVDNNLDVVGGAEVSTKIIIDGIKENILLGVLQPGKSVYPLENIQNYSFSKFNRLKHLIKHPICFIKYINYTRKVINQSEPRIIHTQAQVSFFTISLLSKLRLIKKDIKLIHTERGLYIKYNKFFKYIFIEAIKELDVLVTTTDFNMKAWKNALEAKNIKKEYKKIENTAGDLFESYDYNFEKNSDGSLTIGFAGRYCDWKNWPLAIDICKEIEKKIPNNLYVKMAVGCLDLKSKEETKAMFNDLTILLGDRFEGKININIEEMNKLYYDLDIFILTSNKNTESFGRTLVEAMSRKTVVLTTSAGGSVEVVGDYNNVLNTKEEFANRILEFYYDKKLMKIEKDKNLQRVKDEFSLKNNISKHINLYQ